MAEPQFSESVLIRCIGQGPFTALRRHPYSQALSRGHAMTFRQPVWHYVNVLTGPSPPTHRGRAKATARTHRIA